MKVYILTEGGKDIGFGHLTRCASIYNAFEEKKISPKLIIKSDETANSMLSNFDYCNLEWQNMSFEEKEFQNTDLVIVDSYLASEKKCNEIAKKFPLVAFFDDINRVDYSNSIIINSAIKNNILGYNTSNNLTLLIGPQYHPLRNAFWELPQKTINKKINKILIIFGGNDMRNLSGKVVNYINKEFPDIESHVVLGHSTSSVDTFKNKNTVLYKALDANKLKKLMEEVDIAISASGQTIYELAAVGTPTIAISIADNQKQLVNFWTENNFIEFIGSWNSYREKDLKNAIIKLLPQPIREEKSNIGQSIIDGNGSRRIVEYLINLYERKHSNCNNQILE